MKLQIPFKLLAVMLMIPIMVSANTSTATAKITKEKSIKKSFSASSNTTLKVDNSFGNLDIVTWEENRIEFDITVKVTGSNTDKVQDRLNMITVDFKDSGNIVEAVTKFGNKKNSWWNWGSNKKFKIEVNYRVKMPISNNVNLSNDYGAINLGKIEGNASISCDYGKITTQEIMGDSNIAFDYTNNCYFEYLNNAKIAADYSGFTVAKAKNIELRADYTKSSIENVENVEYTCDFGSLKIDNINNIQGSGDYLTMRLGNVYKNVDIKQADYGSIKIDRMASKAGNINISSEFAGITIGIDSGYSFDFDINLEYASLNYPDTFNFSVKERDNTEKSYRGYNGSSNSGNYVKIDSEYGSVSFKTN